MNEMSGNCGWFTIINNPREEAGVMVGVGDIHIFHHIRDDIVTVLRWSLQAVKSFVEEPKVVRT